MTKRTSAMGALQEVRSYSAKASKSEITQKHHNEARGLALAGQALAEYYGNDPTNPEFLDHLEELADGVPQDGRAYAGEMAVHPGMQLVASKRNPKVRRWVKINAMAYNAQKARKTATVAAGGAAGAAIAKYLGNKYGGNTPMKDMIDKHAGSYGATAGAIAINALHKANERSENLDVGHQNALNHTHYLENHSELVRSIAEHHNVSQVAASHALANIAHSVHVKNKRGNASGVAHLSDAQYHRQLGIAAGAHFVRGTEARGGSYVQ